MIVFLELLLVVVLTRAFFKTRVGEKIGNYLPLPFWIYFLPIVFNTVGAFPKESATYNWIELNALPTAIFLMLIGTPVYALIKMGPLALKAMGLAVVSMIIGIVVSFILFVKVLPPEGWQAAGALLGTWVGGSANMLAVKELLHLPENGFAPLIIVDTVLSYSWMALLILGATYQRWFDRNLPQNLSDSFDPHENLANPSDALTPRQRAVSFILVVAVAFGIAQALIAISGPLSARLSFLSLKGWAVLLTSTAAVLLALTPLQKLEERGATKAGSFVLCLVLAAIGAKTSLFAAINAPVYIAYGLVALGIHGVLMIWGGRIFKLPLCLLATASQANVGGPVSAPIVAGVYRPGLAHVGVLMAIGGAILGTYVGVMGGLICQHIANLFH